MIVKDVEGEGVSWLAEGDCEVEVDVETEGELVSDTEYDSVFEVVVDGLPIEDDSDHVTDCVALSLAVFESVSVVVAAKVVVNVFISDCVAVSELLFVFDVVPLTDGDSVRVPPE